MERTPSPGEISHLVYLCESLNYNLHCASGADAQAVPNKRRHVISISRQLSSLLPRRNFTVEGWGEGVAIQLQRLRDSFWGIVALAPRSPRVDELACLFAGHECSLVHHDHQLSISVIVRDVAEVSDDSFEGPEADSFFNFINNSGFHDSLMQFGFRVPSAVMFDMGIEAHSKHGAAAAPDAPPIINDAAGLCDSQHEAAPAEAEPVTAVPILLPAHGDGASLPALSPDARAAAFITEQTRKTGDAPAVKDVAAFLGWSPGKLHHHRKDGKMPITDELLKKSIGDPERHAARAPNLSRHRASCPIDDDD